MAWVIWLNTHTTKRWDTFVACCTWTHKHASRNKHMCIPCSKMGQHDKTCAWTLDLHDCIVHWTHIHISTWIHSANKKQTRKHRYYQKVPYPCNNYSLFIHFYDQILITDLRIKYQRINISPCDPSVCRVKNIKKSVSPMWSKFVLFLLVAELPKA